MNSNAENNITRKIIIINSCYKSLYVDQNQTLLDLIVFINT